jgi:F-box/WD-40 domain protein 7
MKSIKEIIFDGFFSSGVVWRIKCTDSALVCAAGSRNSTEDTKVIMLDFDRTTICS